VYLDRGVPEKDSVRMRRRLLQQFQTIIPDRRERALLGQRVIAETGAELGFNGIIYDWHAFFLNAPLRDLLDAVTVLYHSLLEDISPREAAEWLVFVQRVFREENVSFSIDKRGGVHFAVDEEFEHNRRSALAVLDHPQMANARASFEDAFRHLEADPPERKAAVRSIFETAEILAKQLVPGASRLNSNLVLGNLKRALHSIRAADAVENSVFDKLLDGFRDWVEALHDYRHGQDTPDPVVPSEELTVFALSTGASYVRLLASCLARAPKEV
jgi:hypothetical protein